ARVQGRELATSRLAGHAVLVWMSCAPCPAEHLWDGALDQPPDGPRVWLVRVVASVYGEPNHSLDGGHPLSGCAVGMGVAQATCPTISSGSCTCVFVGGGLRRFNPRGAGSSLSSSE